MFYHNQILIHPKSYGPVHDVCVKIMCVTAVSAVIFPNHLANHLP